MVPQTDRRVSAASLQRLRGRRRLCPHIHLILGEPLAQVILYNSLIQVRDPVFLLQAFAHESGDMEIVVA